MSFIMDTDVEGQPSNETKRSLPAYTAILPYDAEQRNAHILRYITRFCFGFDNGCGRTCPRSLIVTQYRSCWRRDTMSLPIDHCSVYPLYILYCMRRCSIIPSYPLLLMVFGLPAPTDSNRYVYRNGRRRFWRLPLLTLSAVTHTHSSMVYSRLPLPCPSISYSSQPFILYYYSFYSIFILLLILLYCFSPSILR